MATWFEKWPQLLQTEELLLRNAAMEVERDQRAFDRGIARVRVRPCRPELPALLIVTFPDSFPYFRFEIQAPDGEPLRRHQNPIARNLCVIGRATDNWTRASDEDNTVVSFILNRIPLVIAANDDSLPVEKRPLEDPQAEPVSDYFTYDPGSILVDGDWKIKADVSSGYLDIGLYPSASRLLNAAVINVRDDSRRVLASATERTVQLYSAGTIQGRWIRSEPIFAKDGPALLQKVRQRDKVQLHINRLPQMDLQILALLFPEEVQQDIMGEGWIFICAERPSQRQHGSHVQKPKRKRGKRR